MKIALCIPHLPGIPKRDESFDRLMYTACFSQRETDEGGIPDPFDFVECGDDVAEHVCILTDKTIASAASSTCTNGLTIAPEFRARMHPVSRAM